MHLIHEYVLWIYLVDLVRMQAYLRIPLFIPMKNLSQLKTVLNILMEEVVVLQIYCQAISKKVFVQKHIRMQSNCKDKFKMVSFSCFGIVKISGGNPKICGSKFLRIQH